MIFTIPFVYDAYARHGRKKHTAVKLHETFEFEIPELTASDIDRTVDVDGETYPVIGGIIQVPVLSARHNRTVIPAKGDFVDGRELQQFLSGIETDGTTGYNKRDVREPFLDHHMLPGGQSSPAGRNWFHSAGECHDIEFSNREQQLEAAIVRAGKVLLIDGIVYSSVYEPALHRSYGYDDEWAWTMAHRSLEDVLSKGKEMIISGGHAEKFGLSAPSRIDWQLNDCDFLGNEAVDHLREIGGSPGSFPVASRQRLDWIGHLITDIQRTDDILELSNILNHAAEWITHDMRPTHCTGSELAHIKEIASVAGMISVGVSFEREDEVAIGLLSVAP